MFLLDFCFCFACDAAYENTCRTESEPALWACGRVEGGGGGKDKGAWWVAATSAANRANNGLR